MEVAEENAALDWQKLKQNSEKIGFREGIEEGRVSKFQNSFDEGYKSGFKNGFELGKLKAQLNNEKDKNSGIDNTKRGNCIICLDQSMMETANQDKATQQWSSTQTLITSKSLNASS